jgi:imidazolonepropionase-like amidohydrolase
MQSSLVNVLTADTRANDVATLRGYIHETVRAGTDWIKFYATPNSGAPDPTLPIYSNVEVDSIFSEVRRVRTPGSGHCHGGAAADWCTEHRVDSLEHGIYLEETQFKAMAEHDIPLAPTTSVVLVKPDVGALPRVLETKARAPSYLRAARRHGVRCIPGTGSTAPCTRTTGDDRLRLGPLEAIRAATHDAAKLLRLGDMLGTLQAGKITDVIAIRDDPTADPTALLQVDIVIQRGEIGTTDDALMMDFLSRQ